MLEKSYNAIEREPEIAQKWQEKNLFACHPESNKPPFSIVIPPPNVTGNLHLGHKTYFLMNLSNNSCIFSTSWEPLIKYEFDFVSVFEPNSRAMNFMG